MESGGRGDFVNYTATSPRSPEGGTGGADECQRAIGAVALEEVGVADYYAAHRGVPAAGTPVRVRPLTIGGRLGVETVASGEVIGYLPKKYHYLLRCMAKGIRYEGNVLNSGTAPLPDVTVDLVPV